MIKLSSKIIKRNGKYQGVVIVRKSGTIIFERAGELHKDIDDAYDECTLIKYQIKIDHSL